ncbi:MAG: hypothetical protein F8N37_00505 [Telmatospirillum sp.]|nr:hypothetical protein [Telmatospirillum sp.]
MTTIDHTPLARLDHEGRLLNAVVKSPTGKPGRFGFRGDIALKFQPHVADEKRPPDYSIEQVLTIAEQSEDTLPILVGYLHSFSYLMTVSKVLSGLLRPDGTYIMYCNNIDLLAKYKVTLDDIPYQILPCDESTVWKELLELVGIDKNDIRKLDPAGKLDFVMDVAKTVKGDYPVLSFEDAVARMGPVKNRNENRPV